MITELIWLGTLAIGIIALLGYTVKANKKTNAIVEFKESSLIINWNNHSIELEFEDKQGYTYYLGAKCNEEYSCSLTSTTKYRYPWLVRIRCGNDEVTITTDLKGKYETI